MRRGLKKDTRIGIGTPVLPRKLADLLDHAPEDLPEGLGGTAVTALIRGLVEDGRRVSVYSLDGTVTDIRSFHGPSLSLHVAPFRPHHRMRNLMATERNYVARMIRDDRPDIVGAHWGYEYPLGALATGVPVMTTMHDWAPAILRYSPDPYRAARLLMFIRTLSHRRNHTVTAISPIIAERVARWSLRACRLTPCGLPDAQSIAEPRRLADRPPRLVAINQGFSKFKNVTVLMQAFPFIRAALPGARLTLLGHDFEQGGTAQNWAYRNGFGEGMEFVGQVPTEAVSDVLDQSDLLVHVALEEAFGMVLVEAMARGVPVIAGRDSPGPAWVLDQGRAGLLVDARAPQDVARAALGLFAKPGYWEEISAAGLARVREHFTISAVMQDYLEALDRTLIESR